MYIGYSAKQSQNQWLELPASHKVRFEAEIEEVCCYFMHTEKERHVDYSYWLEDLREKLSTNQNFHSRPACELYWL